MSKTPKLRFKEFSGDWESKKLGNICDVIMGQSPSSTYYNEENIGLPLIQGNADIQGRKTSPRIYTSEITKTCDIGDIIMSVRAPVGAISKSIHNACIGRGVCSIKPNQSNEFIYQFLLRYEDKWSRISQGSTFESVNRTDITDTKVSMPSIEEQEKIASFFSLIDDKISLQSEKVYALKDYKKGIMQKIFSRELRFKDDDGRDYPEWEEKKLGDIAECLDNNRKPLNSKERGEMQGSIPYYGANGVVDFVNDYIFDEDIILLAEDGGNFDDFSTRPIAQFVTGKSWVNNHAHVLRGKYNTEFLFYSLVHKDIRKYINGTSRAKLNKSDMLDILVNVPKSLEEQKKIADVLGAIYSKIEKEQYKLEYLNEYKKGLLQQMFV